MGHSWARLCGSTEADDCFQMLYFERVAANPSINRNSIRCPGNTAIRIFAFLFQDASDRKLGHTILLVLYYGVACRGEKGATRGSSRSIKISLQPLHEFAPTIGGEVV